MKTPIYDFIREYARKKPLRLHTPGHKGNPFLGCELYDITEVAGADELYDAEGIIAQSERNAAALFGTAKTIYSAEGSSQCIKAMVHLASNCAKGSRPWILAARNAHKAFLYGLALSDVDVKWLWPEHTDSVCSCAITAEDVEEALKAAPNPPTAVYVTSPDYLGNVLPIAQIARVCHAYGTLLMVDNAHGAYLHFLPQSRHPMALGADLCCDSAHKTLPVLTGGAYLHIGKGAPEWMHAQCKQAMALFGSTSPSYLILASLDLCNDYLERVFPEKLPKILGVIAQIRRDISKNGWEVAETEPLKITLRCPAGLPGAELARKLRDAGMECEYADRDSLVLMVSTETDPEELKKLPAALGQNIWGAPRQEILTPAGAVQALSVRKALFAPWEQIPVEASLGRIAAAPAISCPPAIPIVVSGERIDENALRLFRRYSVKQVAVVAKEG